jgi:ABC-type multidrug transport system ATPase subunit
MATLATSLYPTTPNYRDINNRTLGYGEANPMSQPIIQCHNLSHSYSGKAALSNVSFEIESGEPVGLVGPNGAGKTTLLSILSGFLRPTSGTVKLIDHKPGASDLSGKVAALPQDARLAPAFSIAEPLAFYALLQGFSSQAAKLEAVRVLELVALKDSLNEKPVTLSHGMGKRVAIAQALIGNPELILLDEPTAGLDPVNTRNIRAIISDLSPETTFIISSHGLTELGRLCQQILLLENGKMNRMQHNVSEGDSSTQFFTIQMESCLATDVIAKLKQLEDVLKVTNPQKNEFIVEYNLDTESKMDLKIMSCLADNNWKYRQFSQGKTLEEKLFFEDK